MQMDRTGVQSCSGDARIASLANELDCYRTARRGARFGELVEHWVVFATATKSLWPMFAQGSPSAVTRVLNINMPDTPTISRIMVQCDALPAFA
ncbi:MAG: hypothetical protein IPG42_11530 [Betaproteobacteria bacterium]|nr:hypothetical protein [Betaproteobacteria bacterium]